MPLQQILPTFAPLNNANFTSGTGMADLRIPTQGNYMGLNPGDYFDLTYGEALSLSYSANGTLYAGRYRFVQVEAGATAAYIKTGTIGLLRAMVLPASAPGTSGVNVVTSYERGLAPGVRPVVFLNSITPGNFGWIQEMGDASVLCGATLSKAAPAIGDILNSVATGLVDDPTSQAYVATTIGVAAAVPAINALCRVLLELQTFQG